MIHITTPRLSLREWQENDLISFYDLCNDELVMEYFPNLLSLDSVKQLVDVIYNEFKQFGYGLYAVEITQTKEFLGFVGFHNVSFDSHFTPSIEIGWRIASQYWGKGYATEAAKACLVHAKEKLKFSEVYSFTSVLNSRSERIMKKIGMKKIETFNHPNLSIEHQLCKHVLYKIKL